MRINEDKEEVAKALLLIRKMVMGSVTDIIDFNKLKKENLELIIKVIKYKCLFRTNVEKQRKIIEIERHKEFLKEGFQNLSWFTPNEENIKEALKVMLTEDEELMFEFELNQGTMITQHQIRNISFKIRINFFKCRLTFKEEHFPVFANYRKLRKVFKECFDLDKEEDINKELKEKIKNLYDKRKILKFITMDKGERI